MQGFKTIRYFLGTAWSCSRAYLLAVLAGAVLNAVLPFIGVFMPKLILDELTGTQNAGTLSVLVGITIGATLLISLLSAMLQRYTSVKALAVEQAMFRRTANVMMKSDYENMEDPEFIDLRERAIHVTTSRAIGEIIEAAPNAISALITMAGTLVVILTFDIFIILAIMALVVVNYLLQRYFQKRAVSMEIMGIDLNKFMNYYINFFLDRSVNKEARLFAAEDFLIKKSADNDKLTYSIVREEFKNRFLNEGAAKLLSAVQTALVFAYVGIRTIRQGLGVGDFSMYVGAAATFDSTLRKLFDSMLTVQRNAVLLTDFIKLNETPLTEHRAGGPVPARPDGGFEIEFRDVNFRYPKTEQYVLRGINLTIRSGERLSIVGRNGAGKTTFIKLLSRLYAPTSGTILLNGVDISTIAYPAYMSILSVVFQDFQIFDFTVFENVALADAHATEALVAEALRQSGVYEDVAGLPLGIHTSAGKEFDDQGTEFSGGQRQKLAIARAVYKDAPILVLDEPTAALDPLAEAETYDKFNHTMIRGKTAVYISHRLSSCKFCDTIIYLEDARIKERGSHEELMEANGGYARMFRIQQEQFH